MSPTKMAKTKAKTAAKTKKSDAAKTKAKTAARTTSKAAPKRKKTAATATKSKTPTSVSAALLDRLVQEATAVRERAYAPYSRYLVGAAIATKRGSIYVGCNVENSTFGATICAERGAIMQMVAHGETEPIACAVITEDGGSPCGICRQVLAEFAVDMPVVLASLASRDGEIGTVVQLKDLLPLAFRLRE